MFSTVCTCETMKNKNPVKYEKQNVSFLSKKGWGTEAIMFSDASMNNGLGG